MKTTTTDPTQGTVFDSGAHARANGAQTSKDAAQSVQKLRASQARVLQMFRLYGAMTDEQLLAYLHDAERGAGVKLMSPSGARSRRSELSKPNMDRMEAMRQEMTNATNTEPDITDTELRARLRVEGFRAPLWDSGRRAVLATGRQAIVWEIAR